MGGVRVRDSYVPENADQAYWLRTLVEGMPQLLWRSCDMGDWTWASPQWLTLTGLTMEQTVGRGWLQALHPDDRPAAMQAWRAARPHGMLDVQFRVRKAADGSYIWHRTRSLPVRNDSGEIVEWLGTTTDIQDLKVLEHEQAELLETLERHAEALEAEIRDRKRAEAQLLYSAFHDDLTKLHNRAFFMGQCKLALHRVIAMPEARIALLTLDLDRFKLVNDSLGHGAGDVLLTIIAKRLRACIRDGDTLARIGGDEFALLLDDYDEAALDDVAQRILAEARRPFWFGRRQVVCSGSLGAAWIVGSYATAEQVLRDADLAMYAAKRDEPGQYRLFVDTMRQGAPDVLDLFTDLTGAVRNEEFEVYYQPICDIRTRCITGVEALVRWNHPKRGLLGPEGFIAAAEDRGLIRDISRFVLTKASRQVREWQEQLPGLELVLHVNLSSLELKDPDLVQNIHQILAETGLQAAALQLEITEGALISEPDQARTVMASLRQSGVRIALDDFGTGYCSLGYLDQYEIDTIKIDRSFIARLVERGRTRAVVAAIVHLGDAMGVEVVAEGVEDGAQLRALTEIGCKHVQGYLFGQPGPARDMTAALQQQHSKPAQGRERHGNHQSPAP